MDQPKTHFHFPALYDILGLQFWASNDEIKKAVNKMSLKHHPDKGGLKEMQQLVNLAKEVLLDKPKRGKYDDILVFLTKETDCGLVL